MAFPVRQSQATSATTTAATSHTINVGSPNSGELMIIFIRFAGAPGTVTFTGYTQFATDSSDASDDTSSLYYRLADGTEGVSDPLTTGNSIKMASVMQNFSGTADPATQAPQTSTVAIGTGANADSTIVTPTGGAKDYMFIVVLGMDGETQLVTSNPAGYGDGNSANSGTGGAAATNCRVWIANQQLNASSQDPGAWTSDAPTTGWTAWTIAVHPVPAATFIEAPSLIAMQAVNRSNVY